MPHSARLRTPPRRAIRDRHVKDAPIFGGEFPPHAFFKHHPVGSRPDRFKLKCPLPVIDRIIPGDAQVVVSQQLEPRRIKGRNPELSSRSVFPEMNLDGMLKSCLNHFGSIRACGTIMMVVARHCTHRHVCGNPPLINCLILLWLAPRPDKNLLAFHLHMITSHTISTAVRPLPVSNIECQVVPRTGYNKALHTPFTQRSAFMWANIMNRKILPLNVEECNLSIVHHDGFCLPRRQLVNQSDGLKPL